MNTIFSSSIILQTVLVCYLAQASPLSRTKGLGWEDDQLIINSDSKGAFNSVDDDKFSIVKNDFLGTNWTLYHFRSSSPNNDTAELIYKFIEDECLDTSSTNQLKTYRQRRQVPDLNGSEEADEKEKKEKEQREKRKEERNKKKKRKQKRKKYALRKRARARKNKHKERERQLGEKREEGRRKKAENSNVRKRKKKRTKAENEDIKKEEMEVKKTQKANKMKVSESNRGMSYAEKEEVAKERQRQKALKRKQKAEEKDRKDEVKETQKMNDTISTEVEKNNWAELRRKNRLRYEQRRSTGAVLLEINNVSKSSESESSESESESESEE